MSLPVPPLDPTPTDTPVIPIGRTWEGQLARQEELEDIGVTKGRERFLSALRKAEEKGRRTQLGGAHSLLLKAMERIEHGITEWCAMVQKRPGPRPVALKWFLLIEPEVVAYLTMKILLDGVHAPRSVYQVGQQIATAIEDELVYRELREKRPALFDYLVSTKFLTQHYGHNARLLKGAVRSNAVDVAHLRISKQEKVHVGNKCMDLCISVTGLFRVELVQINRHIDGRPYRPSQRRDQWQIIAEQGTIEWIEQKNEVLQWLTPMALPMVVEPLPWGPDQAGGYRYGLRERFDLVRGVSEDWQQEVRTVQMPLVYRALNAIQSTAWAINKNVLPIIEAVSEAGGGFANIPALEPEPLPAKPHDIDTNRESRKAWRRAASDTITRNTVRAQAALKFHRLLREVQLLADEPTLYFPHNLDFRGRVYPIATHLSPQGDDLCKGLLTFAEGKPLGKKGVRALGIHGANCMDTDPETGTKLGHLTLDERFAWVVRNETDIHKSANDPLRHRWWAKAEEPWQFLAFCHEWANSYAKTNGRPETYVCALPVHIDGSCNGLQHFAAMFRDEVGGAAVNLTANAKPADVYQRIADTVVSLFRDTPESDPDYPLARRWLASGLITRSLCKRPTMTFSYGSKVFGFQDQILEYLSVDKRETWEETKRHFTVSGTSQTLQAARLLSRTIWRALELNVVKAFEGMDWLQRCAKEVCRVSKAGVRWTVPLTQFPVKQEYYVQRKRHIRTILAGKVVKPILYSATAVPLSKKQQNAVSPNVIHSLDAAALMLAVDYALEHGVTNFAAIHDSYGSIPADMHIINAAAREGFYRLYEEHHVPHWLHACFSRQAFGAIPYVPLTGNLNLREVLRSDYFFA